MNWLVKGAIVAVVLGTETGRKALLWTSFTIIQAVRIAKRTYDDVKTP